MYEFEVKEQDRWLPIANGMLSLSRPRPFICSRTRVPKRPQRSGTRPRYYWHPRFELVHRLAGASRQARESRLPVTLRSWHMTNDSSPKTPEARGASRADKYDELDANIRNFAPVARIMKNALPDNAKIAKEAKECMQECVSEFISFITSEGMSYIGCMAFKPSHKPLTYLGARNTLASGVMCDLAQLTSNSLGKVPPGEAENRQWRRHSVCDDVSRI